MAKDDVTGTEDAARPRDASLRVDTKTLSSEEQDFARMMGFSGDDEAAAAPTPAARPAPKATPTTAPSAATAPSAKAADEAAPVEAAAAEPDAIAAPAPAPAPSATPSASSDDEDSAGEATPAPDGHDDEDATSAPDPVADEHADTDAVARVFEEIHPRAAALGRQTALLERADRVAKLAVAGARDASPLAAAGETTNASGRVGSADDSIWLERLRVRDARIAELERAEGSLRDELARARLASNAAAASPASTARSVSASPNDNASENEKALERLRVELDGLLQERDQLSDELAIANAARLQAQTRAERFEVALRAARGPDGPVPDGERELRAEVVGLRRRLEAASAENRGLRESLETSATDLAIARAHGDDRQQEIEQQQDRIASLEQERAAQVERLDEALVRQRELLALVTRVQAENVELRSTQAALEETLEARDLEINAREEHLQVTRRGLVTRDQQLLDAEERLEQARHRHAVLEAELEQQARAATQLEEKLARRDARIASLSTTLARIEQAIGRTTSALPADEPPAESAKPPRSPARTSESPSDTVAAESAPATASAPAAAAESASAPAPEAVVPAHAPILARWRDAQLRTLFGEEAPASIEAFLARQLVARCANAGAALPILSLGGTRADAEIRFFEALREQGVEAPSIRVLDRSPQRATARRAAIEAAGLGEAIGVESWNGATPLAEAEPARALLVCDALQGFEGADATLNALAAALAPDGVVLFADRIAGGPVTVSAETAEKLAELWQVLPESLTSQAELAHAPEPGDDGGIAGPADDGLAALLEHFAPVLTIGLGHVVDLFVGPARGFALSERPEAAESLLASIEAIDESRSILESLPPRHGVAVALRREACPADGAPEALGLPWPGVSR